MANVAVSFSIPVEIRDEVTKRCEEFGVDPSRLVGGLLLRRGYAHCLLRSLAGPSGRH